jgi:hypothetical protein
MATCPRCKGHLTDTHRCPRSRARVAAELTLAALAGAVIALLLFSIIDPQGRMMSDAVWLLGGALAGVGIDRMIRG